MFTQKTGDLDPRYLSVVNHWPPAAWRRELSAEMDVNSENEHQYRASAQALRNLLKKLYMESVPLLVGTDDISGFTLHAELEEWVRAGIPNDYALQRATLGAARLLKQDHELRSIQEGKIADLILIDGNPLKDISDPHKVSLVIKGEHCYLPDELYQIMGVKPFTKPLNSACGQ